MDKIAQLLDQVDALLVLAATTTTDDYDIVRTGLWAIDEIILEVIHLLNEANS